MSYRYHKTIQNMQYQSYMYTCCQIFRIFQQQYFNYSTKYYSQLYSLLRILHAIININKATSMAPKMKIVQNIHKIPNLANITLIYNQVNTVKSRTDQKYRTMSFHYCNYPMNRMSNASSYLTDFPFTTIFSFAFICQCNIYIYICTRSDFQCLFSVHLNSQDHVIPNMHCKGN